MSPMIELQEAVVIVIEDNADNLMIAQRLLKRAGVRYVNGRASGRQFFKLVETIKDKPIHLILLDLQIPHEDGYTILRQIRSHEQLANTCVIALTANVMPDDIDRTREAGFDGFIGKPINAERFPEQIRRIVSGESVWEPQ